MQAQTTPSPSFGLFLLWALWGAIVDWRYKRRGGRRPTKQDRMLFLICLGICLGGVLLLGYRGASADALGSLSGFLTIVLFSAWEFGRWRIRRKHPIKATPAQIKPAPVQTMEEVDPALAGIGHAVLNMVDKRYAAHHEAGHAVVTCLSPTIELVDVSINADGKGLGRTNSNLFRLEPGLTASQLTKAQRLGIKESIRSLLGGQVAELRFRGPDYEIRCDMGWGDDNRRIAEYLSCIGSEELRELRAETERVIEANWGFVDAVAKALVEKTRLVGAEVENIRKELTSGPAVP